MEANFKPLYELLCESVKEEFPQLANCTSATEASKVMFGVQGMTKFIRIANDERQAVVDFFGKNHSDMIAWAQHAIVTEYSYKWINFDFNLKPEHKKVYKAFSDLLGLKGAVALSQDRNAEDTIKGYEFLKADKKLWKKFDKDILSALSLFPASCHIKMIHDYAQQAMDNKERRERSKADPEARTLPEFANIPATFDEFKILVPKHDKDLRNIGKAQNHCVGTKGMGYANKVRSGNVCIVAVYRNSLADGICVEIDLKNKQVIQAQGRFRREPDIKEETAISKLISLL